MSDERFAKIEASVEQLVFGQGRLEQEMKAFREEVVEQFKAIPALEQRLGNQMRVLHEDVIARIQAISDPTASLRREIRDGDDRVREEFNRRLDPLELTVRDHSAELARIKTKRRSSTSR